MQAMAEIVPMVASILGGWEIILILSWVLVLLGAKRLPEIGRGMELGLREFLKATRDSFGDLDTPASDAGKSLGGIYGKPAAEALTPDNQTAELYDPAVLRKNQRPEKSAKNAGRRDWSRFVRRIWDFVRGLLSRKWT